MMLHWFNTLDINVKSVLISSLTTIIVFLLKWAIKYFSEKNSLTYKLEFEYKLNQKKKIKEIISKSKTPLIQAAENLNYRLWNLNKNIDKCWHNIEEDKWNKSKHYYIRSFAYRFILFYHWIIEAETSVYHLDSTIADKKDKNYMKFIKTLKHVFTDRDLLSEMGYGVDDTENHFYKDSVTSFAKYCVNEGQKVIDFDEFEIKMKKDYLTIKKVLLYISEIKNDDNNYNLNAIRCFHLILMKFLNYFGFDYQYTKSAKIRRLVKQSYKNIKIKHSFITFCERNKIKSEMGAILRYLGIGRIHQIIYKNKIKKYRL